MFPIASCAMRRARRRDSSEKKIPLMAAPLSIGFSAPVQPRGGVLVAFVGADMKVAPAVADRIGALGGRLATIAKKGAFKAKKMTALDVVAPGEFDLDRLLIVGVEPGKDGPLDPFALGGFVMGKLGAAAKADVAFMAPTGEWDAGAAADFALGATLRAYAFDRYKSKKPDADEKEPTARSITIQMAAHERAKSAYVSRAAIGEGVVLARDLVNEPPNVLGPLEFAAKAQALKKLGVVVETLDVKAMERLKMGALLAVGQGSRRPSRMVVMRWNGAKGKRGAPIAFVGKGVCFDTGGISIKPAGSMEDMKGDMGGAACVTGLMHALAKRKAKVNAVGLIGLVENMPDGAAYRPGDILTSASGQTIEVINTDAEGRLVLADVLWYAVEKIKPAAMVDLATLTGAIVVALGADHAGLFSNDDKLAERLTAAGKATGEAVWRMPLGASYDKQIDSRFADMKNTGGRNGGAITAAQFLKRFVKEVPWAHLDVAGTAMSSPASETNTSWASGWGVRLLDRLVADHYEDKA